MPSLGLACMDIITNVTFTLVGILCGWGISHFYSRKASTDLRKQNEMLFDLLRNLKSERFSQQTDKHGTTLLASLLSAEGKSIQP